MKVSFKPTRPQLKVFSAICANLVAVWLIAIFVTGDPLTIVVNLLYAFVTLYLAVIAERLAEK